jgi:Fe-S cluster assembly protein SufD
MDSETKIVNISKDTVEEISIKNLEPEWLLKRRMLAFEQFESTPSPTSRRMDYKHINLENYSLDRNGVGAADSGYWKTLVDKSAAFDTSLAEKNSIVQLNNHEIFKHIGDEYISKGVVLTSLKNAVREHPELIEKYYLRSRPHAIANKYDFLNSAFWQEGTFIYIPKNVEIEIPLTNINIISKENNIYLPFTLIVVDSSSKVMLIDYQTSDSSDLKAFVSNSVNLVIEANAKVDYINIQEYGASINHFATKSATLKRDATLNWVEVALGSNLTKNNLVTIMEEPGSEAMMSGMFLAGQDQQMEFNTAQVHSAPHATSDLLYVGALRDRAHSNYEGIIRVHKGAQKTDAYQKNKNLLLSREAKADSEPFLEIEANDVRCTHGATVGPIEKEDLFYLMSRGIPKELAVKLLVLGFFSKVIGKIPLESVRTGLESYIQERAVI